MSELPWTWLIIRGSGITAWALLTLVVVWGLLLRTRMLSNFAPAHLLTAHRTWGSAALAALAVHLIILAVDPVVPFTPVEMLVPGLAPWQPGPMALGTLAAWLLLAPGIAFSAKPLLKRYGARAFKWAHKAAYASWPAATAHFVMAGTDTMLLRWSILTAAVFVAFLLLVRGTPRSKKPAIGRHARTTKA